MFFGRSLLVLAPLLATVAYAAECANWNGDMNPFLSGHEDMLWSLRQRMCGNGECGNEQTCTLRGYSKDGGANLYRKDVQYEYPNCWDATANIITQCSRNWWTQGWWQLGDEFYQLNVSPDFSLKRDLGNVAVEEEAEPET